MNQEPNTKPKGRFFAQIGQILIQYEGTLEADNGENIRIFDFKLQQYVDIQKTALRQVIWKEAPPAQNKAVGGA